MHAFTVLGIETSCDETAAAVVRGAGRGPGEILSNVVFSQLDAHRPYGGVVPEIAARAHVEMLDSIVERALGEAETKLGEVNAVAATAGPGLVGGVMVGLLTAKALALAAGKPLVAVNHLEAHGLSARLSEGLEFPFLLLLVSGGHCQLLGVEGVGRFKLYGTTIDDAAGEAFDKTAKLLGLAYPGGPRLEALAKGGNAERYDLPRPMRGREGADFSFSGLKTAVRQLTLRQEVDAADLAASFQAAVIDILRDRTSAAMAMFVRDFPQAASRVVVMAGGVAANGAIRSALAAHASARGFALKVPPPGLCTDNAAMVAWAGIERVQLGLFDPLNVAARARWPLAQSGEVCSGSPQDYTTTKNNEAP
ncbi:MAG: tRNA (adenosine(37)-N6)-threonylcarbamoyltransferase complex transferase subunit TsaD [Alphaproteobacteria bacterium]|nr:tRNA (adenosine(37)-N6)-threonylcarbamoyltransferase complex transferase subunit TsaD [Alphaproteobacteria bacterium]MDE2629970.1 tRNA (adenosine(37)-N6)-threonylcarbamoyltransferase complex transferase subunit TsaD [Alphaproteobacteria bacterium]